MTIQPAITFTLSEDEASEKNGVFADVENQLHIQTEDTSVKTDQAVGMEEQVTANNDDDL